MADVRTPGWFDDGGRGMTVVEIITPTERYVPTPPTAPRRVPIERLAGEFLVGYRNKDTRRGYETDIRIWLEFCVNNGIDPYDARRSHFSLFMHHRELIGNGPATINRKMTSLTSFYQWLVDEEYLERNAAKRAPRPIVPQETSRDWLTGVELARCVSAAEEEGGYTYALICILAFNALRISEVANANIDDLATDRHHQTLRIMGKGTKPATVVLNGQTKWALDTAHAGRTEGPLILTAESGNGTLGGGYRLTRDSAGRTCHRIAKAARIKGKNITPHSFRHSAITAAHDAGADPRAVMEFARHAKLVTTQRYDHKPYAMDASLSYRLSGYVAERSE